MLVCVRRASLDNDFCSGLTYKSDWTLRQKRKTESEPRSAVWKSSTSSSVSSEVGFKGTHKGTVHLAAGFAGSADGKIVGVVASLSRQKDTEFMVWFCETTSEWAETDWRLVVRTAHCKNVFFKDIFTQLFSLTHSCRRRLRLSYQATPPTCLVGKA